jgi:hypothetical protein
MSIKRFDRPVLQTITIVQGQIIGHNYRVRRGVDREIPSKLPKCVVRQEPNCLGALAMSTSGEQHHPPPSTFDEIIKVTINHLRRRRQDLLYQLVDVHI